MNHKGTVIMYTERLILRPFTEGDARAMYKNWARDPEVTRYLTWPAHKNREESLAVIKEWVKGYCGAAFYRWRIALKDEPQNPFGSISVVKCDENTGTAEIGYCTGRKFWHKGYTSEAARAVTGFLFREVGAERVQARHDTRNPRSGRVMRRCGMKYEGTLRRADRNNSGICDAAYYGILRNEWEAGRV